MIEVKTSQIVAWHIGPHVPGETAEGMLSAALERLPAEDDRRPAIEIALAAEREVVGS